MANSNCLKGMRCPNPSCKSRGPFHIVGTATFEVYDEGTDTFAGVEWEATSHCHCLACGDEGTVATFTRGKQPPPPSVATPPAPRYWVITHEHRHGTSQTIFTHDGEPDRAVVIAWATRMLDYEDQDGEWLTLEECDPFLTYTDIVADTRQEKAHE